jgi:hypothetical protein
MMTTIKVYPLQRIPRTLPHHWEHISEFADKLKIDKVVSSSSMKNSQFGEFKVT